MRTIAQLANLAKPVSKLVARRKGSALVAAMVFIVVFGIVVGYVMLASTRQNRNAYRSRMFNTSLAAAATMVKSMSQQAYFMARTRPVQMAGDFKKMDDVILSIQPANMTGYKSGKSGNKNLTFFKASSNNNGSSSVINDPNDDWNGFNIQRWSYDAVAFMRPDDPAADRLGFDGAGFTANIQVNFIPLYQYAIFYNKDLEIHNANTMTVKGPVHTNSTMWLTTSGNLNFYDRVNAAKNIRSYGDFAKVVSSSMLDEVNMKNAYFDDSHAGTVSIFKKGGTKGSNGVPNSSSMFTMNSISGGKSTFSTAQDSNKNGFIDSLDNSWTINATSRWNGTMADASMGVKTILPPLPFVDDGKGGRVQADPSELIQRANSSDNADMKINKMEYFNDIRIVGNPEKLYNNVNDATAVTIERSIKNADGYVTGYETTKIANKPNSNSTPLVTGGKFYDKRQESWVYTLDVNLGELKSRDSSLGYIKNGNGLLYVSTNGGSGMPSVRLQNGSSIPSSSENAFTVATDRPMYLEGNINNPSGSRPTLLLAADAITVTSQKLTEANTKSSQPSVSVSEVVTNAIFMLGQVSSKYDDGNDLYEGGRRTNPSGGAHNVLRYLEQWGGKKHTFNGSLICLFESQVATGKFWRSEFGSTGPYNMPKGYYTAPNRNYNWDADLMTRVPPVGMPKLVEVKMTNMQQISKSHAIARLNSQ